MTVRQLNFGTGVCSPQALTRWGGALLELAHFQQGDDARNMIREAYHLPAHATDLELAHKHAA